MGYPSHDEKEIYRPIANDLIGNVYVAASRVADLRRWRQHGGYAQRGIDRT